MADFDPHSDPAGEPAPEPAADALSEAAAAPSTALLSPLSILGIISLVVAAGLTAALLLRGEGSPVVALAIGATSTGLLGGWLVTWGRPAKLLLALALGLLGTSAFTFSFGWFNMSWIISGAGGGCLGAWAYARRHRAVRATYTLLASGYLVAVAAALLAAMRTQGHWWIIGQGLGSLILGGLLLRFGTSDAPVHEATIGSDAAPAVPRQHGRLRITGRLLIVAGILLPYLGLALMALGKAMNRAVTG
ncbi:MAG: hypothetical protein PF961_04565 [Planctomycetota bacterium]|jgi:hypothetical protein|nr:hypothetical protein [Planctomycetota bacterium]